MPFGVGFDPGGIGKGLAADLVASELIELGAEGVCVNVGGDLRVIGDAPDGAAWRVEVEDPRGGRSLGTVVLQRWRGGDELASAAPLDQRRRHRAPPPDRAAHGHERVDRGAGGDRVASEGWRAEVLAKVAFLDGLSTVGVDGAALARSARRRQRSSSTSGGVVTNERWRTVRARRPD